ncbi:hypothetical protein SEA_NAPOLEONB_42 [Arthrobacter phage NapoleonB]|uniref:Membrane protein n=1 Tax=Arthrobacter phage Dynamite TaxID=2867479 RepID=A0AAE9BRY2_9CAUD|nr:membrane protein [Arthrobacter phage Dynamite]QFP95010.1 hypothetical protein SEA_NAPOLEONB_42 [Arthrobacter phage NapoleonB]UAW09203.1 membrane protein [Arthrobacter phage Dynamite]
MSKLSILAKGARKALVDHAPSILTGIAVAGVATTAVMAVRATPEAIRKIDIAEDFKGEKLTPREVFQETWLFYVPAAATGIVTVSCIVGANHISNRRTAALAGAYSLIERSYSDYQEYVKKEFGERKAEAVHTKIAEETVQKMPESLLIVPDEEGRVRCLETFTQQFFWCDHETLRKAENDINYLIINDSYASLNDFYERVGLPHTEIGEELGWTLDMPLELQFSSSLDSKHRPVLAFRYSATPIRNYHRLR